MSEFQGLADVLLAAPTGVGAALVGAAAALWQVAATLVLLAVPGWLLSRRLGILVRGAPERLVVTLAGSLGVLIVGGFVLNVTPRGLTSGSWMAWVGAITTLLASGSLFRFITRQRTRRVTRLVAAPGAVPRRAVRLATDLRANQVVLLVMAVLVAVSAVVVARASADAPAEHGFTQLWVLGPEEGTTVGAPPAGMVRVGVENHEGRSLRYRVVASSGGRSLTTWRVVDLRDGEDWTTLAPLPADGSLQIRLYVADGTSVYRSVHIGPEQPS